MKIDYICKCTFHERINIFTVNFLLNLVEVVLETLRLRFLNEDGGKGEGIDTTLCLVSVQGASVQTRFRPGH